VRVICVPEDISEPEVAKLNEYIPDEAENAEFDTVNPDVDEATTEVLSSM
jgi:hypothetical protein